MHLAADLIFLNMIILIGHFRIPGIGLELACK